MGSQWASRQRCYKTRFLKSKRLRILAIILMVVMGGENQLIAQERKERGLWIEVVGPTTPLQSRESIDTVIRDAKAAHVTDLYVQVLREGKAWFRSSYAEAAWQVANKDDHEFDPLGYLLGHAGASNLKVHAWLNVFNLHENDNAFILNNLGPEILITDNTGVRIDQYSGDGSPRDSRDAFFRLDTPGFWLDPGDPAVKQYYQLVISELLELYPDLAGIHLDYFRYPFVIPLRPGTAISLGFDLGYGEVSRRSFKETQTIDEPFVLRVRSSNILDPINTEVSFKWDQWRRSRLDNYLTWIKQALTPAQELSVAVIPYSDRAYLNAFQDWRKWLSAGLVSKVCLMAYTKDDALLGHLVREAVAFKGENSRVIAGIGAYLHSDPKEIHDQERIALSKGADGTLLFSYKNIKKKKKDFFELLSS